MAPEEIETVDIPNGETIAYRSREGGDIPVVLVHGNISSSKHWDVVFERLDDRFSLYAPDMRGFGESSYETPIDSLSELAEDLEYFVDAMGLDTFSLWGWSTGAGVAMTVAADLPDRVRRLVLMAPPGTQGLPFYEKDDDLQPTDTVLTTREELAQDPVAVRPGMEATENNDYEAMREIWEKSIFYGDGPDEERFDAYVREALKQRHYLDICYALVHFNISTDHNGIEPGTGEVEDITAPTLVLRGDHDYVVTREMSEEVAADIEDARFVELIDSGHGPTIDAPEQLFGEVVPFLAGE